MKKLILAALCLFAPVCLAQTAQPLFQPQQHFVDNSGNPCAGCKLYSWFAGTTNPQPTYTDATEAHQNQNPVVLDASGSAAIWMGSSAYKFALIDTFGTTLWTVDNVLAPTPGNQSNAFLPLAGGTMSGNINMGGNSIVNAQNIGVGTSTPNWAIDVASGQINSNGFLYNGLAPTNHILLGNGQYYVDSATFPWGSLSGIPVFYYQTVEANGTAQTQRTALNFNSTLAVTDSASPAQTNVGLPAIGTSGSYTCATVTFDAQGRETAANSNTCAPPPFTGTSNYQTLSSGLILEWGVTSAFDTGPLTVTLPFTLPHGCLFSQAGDNIASSSRRIFASGNCTSTSVQIKNDGNGFGNWLVIGW